MRNMKSFLSLSSSVFNSYSLKGGRIEPNIASISASIGVGTMLCFVFLFFNLLGPYEDITFWVIYTQFWFKNAQFLFTRA